MHAVIAALGWVLAVFFFVTLVRAARILRESRGMLEELLREHRPADFARYAALLAERGEKPITPSNKEP